MTGLFDKSLTARIIITFMELVLTRMLNLNALFKIQRLLADDWHLDSM